MTEETKKWMKEKRAQMQLIKAKSEELAKLPSFYRGQAYDELLNKMMAEQNRYRVEEVDERITMATKLSFLLSLREGDHMDTLVDGEGDEKKLTHIVTVRTLENYWQEAQENPAYRWLSFDEDGVSELHVRSIAFCEFSLNFKSHLEKLVTLTKSVMDAPKESGRKLSAIDPNRYFANTIPSVIFRVDEIDPSTGKNIKPVFEHISGVGIRPVKDGKLRIEHTPLGEQTP